MKCGTFLIQINICVAFCGGCKQRTDKQKVNSSVSQPWGDDKKEKDQWGKLKDISQMFIDKQMLLSIQNNFWWNHNLEEKKKEMMIANTASICNHLNYHIRLYSWHTLHCATIHMVLFFMLWTLPTNWNMWTDSEQRHSDCSDLHESHSFHSDHLIKFSMHKQQKEFTQWSHPISVTYIFFLSRP